MLSLDALRVIQKSNALQCLFADIEKNIASVQSPELQDLALDIRNSSRQFARYTETIRAYPRQLLKANARTLSYRLARIYAASLLLTEAEWCIKNKNDRRAFIAAERWCAVGLEPLTHTTSCSYEDACLLGNG
ncbi:MAG: hypothetical protein AAB362_01180 [Patescibacteria group bacterium]